jgi:hypothetical protein
MLLRLLHFPLQMYLSISSVDKGMLKNNAFDGLGPDHLQFEQNLCGFVFDVDLNEKYVATGAKVLWGAGGGGKEGRVGYRALRPWSS